MRIQMLSVPQKKALNILYLCGLRPNNLYLNTDRYNDPKLPKNNYK